MARLCPNLDPCTLSGFEQVMEADLAEARYFTRVYSMDPYTTEGRYAALDEFTRTYERLKAEFRVAIGHESQSRRIATQEEK